MLKKIDYFVITLIIFRLVDYDLYFVIFVIVAVSAFGHGTLWRGRMVRLEILLFWLLMRSTSPLLEIFFIFHYIVSYIEAFLHQRIKYQPIRSTIGGFCCAICIEDIVIGQNIIKMDCKHIFHSDCILRWFRESLCCPICRSS